MAEKSNPRLTIVNSNPQNQATTFRSEVVDTNGHVIMSRIDTSTDTLNGNHFLVLEGSGLESWGINNKAIPKEEVFGKKSGKAAAIAVIDETKQPIAFLVGRWNGDHDILTLENIQYPSENLKGDMQLPIQLQRYESLGETIHLGRKDGKFHPKERIEYLNALAMSRAKLHDSTIDKHLRPQVAENEEPEKTFEDCLNMCRAQGYDIPKNITINDLPEGNLTASHPKLPKAPAGKMARLQ